MIIEEHVSTSGASRSAAKVERDVLGFGFMEFCELDDRGDGRVDNSV